MKKRNTQLFATTSNIHLQYYDTQRIYERQNVYEIRQRYGQVNFYISPYPNNVAQSHIFSLPCSMTDIYTYIITYGFKGDLHRNVRILYLSDSLSI